MSGRMLYNRRHARECAYGCCRALPKDRKRRKYHGVLRAREKRATNKELREEA